MSARGWLIALGVVLLGAAVGLFIFANMEKGERQIWVGYQGEARYNDFLAAQRMLVGMGNQAESLWHLPTEADLKDAKALIMPRRGRRLSPGQMEAVLDWVEKGGVLLAEGAWAEEGDGASSQDPLFAAFGARLRYRVPSHDDIAKPAPEDDDEPAFSNEAQKHPRVYVRVGDVSYALEVGSWYVLEAKGSAPSFSVSDSTGVKALVFNKGKGQAILLTSLSFLSNDRIADADHGPFLAAIAKGSKKVIIVVREEAPSLLAWLKTYARFPLAVLAVLTLLSIWRGFPRFGPKIPDVSLHRRSLLEHLAACGRFQWRHRDGRSLLKASREAMMTRLRRAHPAWAALPPDQLCAKLATFTGLPEPRIFQALRYDTQTQARDFFDAIQLLDLIRKKL